MAGEHIGRLQHIGIGKESTSGTAVSASAWIPKAAGVFAPKHTVAMDEGAYGIIDGTRDVQTVQNMTDVSISAMIRDKYIGHFLTAALGSAYDCVRFPISGITGTFSEGETITESVSSATGVLRRSDQSGGTPVLYIDPASGTFTGGQTLTGGTSSATATGGTIESPSALKHHVFRRLNTNNHPAFTIYGSDPIGDERAVYCMLDSLNIEVVVGDFAKFEASFMGKTLASTSTQTPSFVTEYPFLAKFANFYAASAWTGLDAAAATKIERMSLTITKNLTPYQAFGSTNVESFHNQRFDVSGSITLLHNTNTFRDYVTSSTKRAIRLRLANTDVTIGSAANPLLQFDFPSVALSNWTRTPENDTLVKESFDFTAEYDVSRNMTVEALLANTTLTAY